MENNRRKKYRCRTKKQKIDSLKKQLEHADYMSTEANLYNERVEWFQKKCELKSRKANASLTIRPVVPLEKQKYKGYIRGKLEELEADKIKREKFEKDQEEEFRKREEEKRNRY